MTGPERHERGAGQPRVSVIVPVHNGAPFVGEALASIRAQHHDDLEIVVVDDGSVDGTAEVAAREPAVDIVVSQERRGPGGARNTGAAHAQGELLAFLDADDLWPRGKLDVQLACFDAHPGCGIVLGRFVEVPFVAGDDPGEATTLAPAPWWTFACGASIMTRTAFEAVGPFDEQLEVGEDTDWYLRAKDAGVPMVYADGVMLVYRRHPGSVTSGRSRTSETLAIVRRHLQRRR